MNVYEIRAKRILNPTTVPNADYVINPYVGCQHACVYCYARFVCRWRKKKEKWGEFVEVKVNAPQLIKFESRGKTGRAIISTVCDAYQPVEKGYRITRKILQNVDRSLEISVLTKSDLIVRDIDILKDLNAEAGLSISFADESVKKLFEPKSPSVERRIDALKTLADEGIRTFVFVSPIMPYLTDIEEILKEVSFVDIFRFEDLNLKASRTQILSGIREHFPELELKYRKLNKEFWKNEIKKIFRCSEIFKKPVEIYFERMGYYYPKGLKCK